MPTSEEVKAGNLLIDMIKRDISPKHQDKFKAEERSSKVLGYLLAPFNPRYYAFNTTRYPDIFWGDHPGRKESVTRRDWGRTKTRAHEGVHMWDRKRFWWLFNIMYGAPHSLAPLFLIPFLILGGWWALAGLGCMVAGTAIGYIMARKKWWFFPWVILGVVAGVGLSIWKVQWQTFWLGGFALCASPALNFLGASYYRAWAEFRGYTMSIACNYWRHGNVLDSTLDWIVKHYTGGNYYWMLPWKGHVRKVFAKRIETIKNGSVLEDPIFKKVHSIMLVTGLTRQRFNG
jgi:hypothetical protein